MAKKVPLPGAGEEKQRPLKETKKKADQAGPHGKQPHEIAEYKTLGALDVIPKPFDPVTLADTVKSIWLRARAG